MKVRLRDPGQQQLYTGPVLFSDPSPVWFLQGGDSPVTSLLTKVFSCFQCAGILCQEVNRAVETKQEINKVGEVSLLVVPTLVSLSCDLT